MKCLLCRIHKAGLKEATAFINWIAEKYPEQYKILVENYSKEVKQ